MVRYDGLCRDGRWTKERGSSSRARALLPSGQLAASQDEGTKRAPMRPNAKTIRICRVARSWVGICEVEGGKGKDANAKVPANASLTPRQPWNLKPWESVDCDRAWAQLDRVDLVLKIERFRCNVGVDVLLGKGRGMNARKRATGEARLNA